MANSNNRILSLDVFRGLTIALMILVNTPGSWKHVYAPFLHADWHGCTPTDLVFPFFLFIVGTSIYFSNKKFKEGYSNEKLLKILKRTLFIFLIGLALNWFPFYDKHISDLRIMGVLQRIALAYGFAAILLMFLKNKGIYIVGALLLFGYWALLYFFGGNDPYSLESNVVRTFDRFVLGDAHLWGGKGIPFDPEGLLSTIPSIVTVFIGYLSGKVFSESSDKQAFVRSMISAGLVLLIVGFVWGFIFPINKSLWTSSYVLYVGGLAMITLGALTWIIDIMQWKSWTKPFLHFGRNPLFIYILSGIYARILWKVQINDEAAYTSFWKNIFVPIFGEMFGSLAFA
ncbi:MAG: heparan-alpha-glucosaminide N-acetyltransferase domain-containing protein, partial [Bacteroidota bacterium]